MCWLISVILAGIAVYTGDIGYWITSALFAIAGEISGLKG